MFSKRNLIVLCVGQCGPELLPITDAQVRATGLTVDTRSGTWSLPKGAYETATKSFKIGSGRCSMKRRGKKIIAVYDRNIRHLRELLSAVQEEFDQRQTPFLDGA